MTQVKNRNLLIAGVIIAAAIFISDIYTPLGIADAVSYVALVLLTLWSTRRSHTVIAAIVGTVLTIAGIYSSPAGEIVSVFIANRVLALIGIWAAAFVILRFKRSENESRKMRDSLNALFTYATEGILIADRHGKIQMINPETEKQFGYEKAELIGKTIEVLVPGCHAETHWANLEYFTGQESRTIGVGMEMLGKRKDASEFPVEISLSSYMLDGEQFVVAFIVNITERKKQQEELKQSHEELKQYAHVLKETNAELENFAYISSHDLQEPLRKIQSFGDRLQTKDADALSEQGKDYLARMLNASARMQRLINDLLSFSRLTSRSQAYEKVDLNVFATEVMSDMEVTIAKSKAHILVDPLPEVTADPTQMRQLFQNLIGNAIKFKQDGENPIVHISSQTVAVDNRNFVAIQFQDNGIGFDEKYSEKIFGIFQRLDGSKFEGSGIGLAICKKIALRHGGTITVNSTPGSGSVFKVMLPLISTQAITEHYDTESKVN